MESSAKENRNLAGQKRPEWLRKKIAFGSVSAIKGELRKKNLHTVCESAKCPNMGECFTRNTATFMILGDVCSRTCTFCAVHAGNPTLPDTKEPENVANMAREMGLKHIVITSVTRDDLPDGGAQHYANTVKAVREMNPHSTIELLIPDFNGDKALLDILLASKPDVLNHNIETVPSLYHAVRPQADFQRSLDVLAYSALCGVLTKSGIMVGLGETEGELVFAIGKLKEAGVKMLTVGQYLAPSRKHAPVVKYYEESFFKMITETALGIGIEKVFAAPFVRSSYMADRI
jgi:lipoic acid synthetase